jgi:hypothetical protein
MMTSISVAQLVASRGLAKNSVVAACIRIFNEFYARAPIGHIIPASIIFSVGTIVASCADVG